MQGQVDAALLNAIGPEASTSSATRTTAEPDLEHGGKGRSRDLILLQCRDESHSLSTLTTRDTEDCGSPNDESPSDTQNSLYYDGTIYLKSLSDDSGQSNEQKVGWRDKHRIATPSGAKILLKHQKQITSLQSWSVQWGAYCRRTATKENQDGWFVLRSILDSDQGNGARETPDEVMHDNNNGGTRSSSKDVDAIQDESDIPSECAIPSLYTGNHWGCWDEEASAAESSKPRRRSTGGIDQIPSPNTLNDLSNRIMAMNLDSLTTPSLSVSSLIACRSPDDSRGGSSSTGVSISHHQYPSPLWSMTCLRPWVFAVLDGHGSGGKLASHEASRTLTECIQERLLRGGAPLFQTSLERLPATGGSPGCPNAMQFGLISPEVATRLAKVDMKERLCRLRDTLQDAFVLAQEKLIASNIAASRDFGTTAVVTACMGRYMLTATCGDSSAVLVVSNPHHPVSSTVIVNVQLSVDHTLLSTSERARISSEGKGRIVVGDGGVHRLIPGFFSYEQAKMKGLSINMARALGHFLLSKCSLSPQPQMTLVDLSDIYQTLQDLCRNAPNETHSYLFEAREFEDTLEHKFKRADEAASKLTTRTTTTGTSSASCSSKSEVLRTADKEGALDLRREEEGEFYDQKEKVEKNVMQENCEVLKERRTNAKLARNNQQSTEGRETTTDNKEELYMTDVDGCNKQDFGNPTVSNTDGPDDEDIVVVMIDDQSRSSPIPSLSNGQDTLCDRSNQRESNSCQPQHNHEMVLCESSAAQPTTKTSSGGRKRRSVVEDLGRNSPTEGPTTQKNWGIRGKDEATLDWLSPDDDLRVNLEAREGEAATVQNGEMTALTQQQPFDINGEVSVTNGEKSGGIMAVEPTTPQSVGKSTTSNRDAEMREVSVAKSPSTSPREESMEQDSMEDDEWGTRLRNPEFLQATSKLIQESTTLLISMSDGISDVLSRNQIGELALMLDKTGNTSQQISELITFKAAQIRRQRGFRADNCTCVVAKLAPCLDKYC